MPVIKRYSNRKLYNTETKQYITLDEIASLIRGREEIQVVDNDTGKDLTALTLTQIIFEQVKQQTGFLPHNVLTGLIQAGGERISAIQKSLIQSLGLKHDIDVEISQRISHLVKLGELEAVQGERLLGLLLSEEAKNHPEAHTDLQPIPNEEVVRRILEERGVASRNEVKQILEQIETLNARLDEINPTDEG